MYKEIELETQEGKKTFPFLATGTTAYRYKQCFHQDLMIALNNMKDTADDQADMTVGDKLAFIMNAQAEKKDMNKQNVDAFLEWADQRMMKIVYLSAVSPCKTVASIYIPCSVKAYGGLRRPPNCPEKNDEFREVTICDFTDSMMLGSKGPQQTYC